MAKETPSRDTLVALARSSARQAGVPDDAVPIFLGMIEQESGWNPRAISKQTRYGKAKGLGQLIDATAKRFGVVDPYDPVQNLKGAASYFSQLLQRYAGDAGLAAAAYNWGEGNVDKMVANPKAYRPPDETANYVPAVYKNALAYGGQSAPSATTLAKFPGLAKVGADAVAQNVADRLSEHPDAITRGLQNGRIETMPPENAGAGAQIAGLAAGIDQTPNAEMSAMGVPKRQPKDARKAVMDFDTFMSERFGPLAQIADPFPKTFDAELMRIIKET